MGRGSPFIAPPEFNRLMFLPGQILSSAQLPTLPTVAVQLLHLMRDPETDTQAVIEVIRADPASCARILKSTNSTLFGLAARVTSVERAVPLLGTTLVTSLALSFSLSESTMSAGPLADRYRSYWWRSIVQATAAEQLARLIPGSDDAQYFLAGLLMDIGHLALLKTAPQECLRVLEQAAQEPDKLLLFEREILGIGHQAVGGQLMREWNLDDSLVRIAECHHATLEELGSHSAGKEFPLLVAAAAASSIGDIYCTTHKGPALERLRNLTAAWLPAAALELEPLLEQIAARLALTANLFPEAMDRLGDPAELMCEANTQLASLAVKAHVASAQAAAQRELIEVQKQALESRHRQLQLQAVRDTLTGLFNRQFLEETLVQEVERCSRNANSLGVIFADIDRFKSLNDTYGHFFGDEVLKKVARALASVTRASDTLARYGGEEFVVLLSQPTENGLAKVAERLRQRVAVESIEIEGKPIPVTVSIGGAITIPSRGDKSAGVRLLNAADEAMYESKLNGRNRVHLRVLLDDTERRVLQAVNRRRLSRWLVNRQVLDIPTISQALAQAPRAAPRIGELARAQGVLDGAAVDLIVAKQERTGSRFGQAAIALGLLAESQLIDLLVIQQEDPLRLASTLAELELIEPDRMQHLLQAYLHEHPGCAPLSAVPG